MSDKKSLETKPKQAADKFIEGIDYYFDGGGLMILTEHFLLKRGYCCGNGCRHCPYPKDGSVELKQKGI